MPPLSLMVKPASGLCNMRCTYCFYQDVSQHRSHCSYGIMSAETLENLIRRAFAYADSEVSLVFQGGEPTLAGKDFFRRLLALEERYNLRGLAVRHAIQTNGYALDEEWADLFLAGNFLVGVSLDGTPALHDAARLDALGQPTYQRVTRNIAMLKRKGVPYNILCVVSESIANDAAGVFAALREHQYLQFIPCIDPFDGGKTPWTLQPETYGKFLIDTFDMYEAAWVKGKPVSVRTFDNWVGILLGQVPECCSMRGQCGVYYLLEADGSVYPCDFYVLDHLRMGNINVDSFHKLARSPVAAAFREASHMVAEPCQACAWYPLCRGGCRRDRETACPGQLGMNRLCGAHRAFFSARMNRLEKLAERIARQRNARGIRP